MRELRRGLHTVEFRTVSYVSGPLLFIERATGVHSDEVVDVVAPDGELRRGRVLEVNRDRAVVEVFAGTRGLDLATTRIRLGGDAARLGVTTALLGRMFDGSGRPVDGGPPVMPEAFWDINGLPINPAARSYPSEFIETGISAIDGLNTLVRGWGTLMRGREHAARRGRLSGPGAVRKRNAGRGQTRDAPRATAPHSELSARNIRVPSRKGVDDRFADAPRVLTADNVLARRSDASCPVASIPRSANRSVAPRSLALCLALPRSVPTTVLSPQQ